VVERALGQAVNEQDDDDVTWTQCVHVGLTAPEYARLRVTGLDHDGQPVSLNLIACAKCARVAWRKLEKTIHADTELSVIVDGKAL
jgi:hypothetical protein